MDTSLMGKSRTDSEVPPLTEEFHRAAKQIIARYPSAQSRSALLPLLYLAQSEHGFVSPQAMREIGSLLGLSRAEVGAVATFYTMFKRDPQGRWLVSVCTQPSCALAGGRALLERLQETLGIATGETTEDRAISIEEVECLCACDGAPVFQINYENYERMSVDSAAEMIGSLRGGATPPAGARGGVPEEFKPVSRRMAGLTSPMPRARETVE
jgi:NADH-quinone oxidoreductase subunit E